MTNKTVKAEKRIKDKDDYKTAKIKLSWQDALVVEKVLRKAGKRPKDFWGSMDNESLRWE